MRKILIVDDVRLNREMLKDILQADYEIELLENGEQAINRIAERSDDISAILLDLYMPIKDGFCVIAELKKRNLMGEIPVLIISSERSVAIEKQCFNLGVSEFVHKPFDPLLVKTRVRNIVKLFAYKNSLESRVKKQTETVYRQYMILKEQAKKLEESNEKIIDILGTVVESRNLESGEHIKRVKGLTRILANQIMEDYPEYGLDEDFVEVIVAASSLHDVGKISIPDNILLKPGRLTEEEFMIMKSHTIKGCEIVEKIEDIWDEEYKSVSYQICRHHHERFDGRGYPDKLVGDEIPIAAQIVSIADVYDALVCERVYKKAFPKDVAFHMIMNGDCGIFSPKLLESFRKVKEEYEAVACG